MKFCTMIDHQIFSLNLIKDLHKTNAVIDNDVIILRPLSVAINSIINGHIMLKFSTGVAHDKTILLTK